MNRHPRTLIIAFSLFITQAASAASEGGQNSSDTLISSVFAFLPILVFLGILFWFFRRQMKSPVAKLQEQYLERQIQHTQRIEELLERIATALEKE